MKQKGAYYNWPKGQTNILDFINPEIPVLLKPNSKVYKVCSGEIREYLVENTKYCRDAWSIDCYA